jgi:hypothetical protein
VSRFRPHPIAAFAAVTLVIWGNRVWLAWSDPKVAAGAKLVSTAPITAFVLASGATLVSQWRGRQSSPGFRMLVSAFAGGTVVYWAVRLPLILGHAHPGPFKVVHAVLGVGSMALAAGAWRARPPRRPSPAAPRRTNVASVNR